jgi:hypothetical protein
LGTGSALSCTCPSDPSRRCRHLHSRVSVADSRGNQSADFLGPIWNPNACDVRGTVGGYADPLMTERHEWARNPISGRLDLNPRPSAPSRRQCVSVVSTSVLCAPLSPGTDNLDSSEGTAGTNPVPQIDPASDWPLLVQSGCA